MASLPDEAGLWYLYAGIHQVEQLHRDALPLPAQQQGAPNRELELVQRHALASLQQARGLIKVYSF